MNLEPIKKHRYIITALTVSLLLRIILYPGIMPNVFPDSDSYDRGARALMKEGAPWGSYPRTPVYPAWLALVYSLAGDKNYQAVVFTQVFLFGLANAAILYFLTMRLTQNQIIATIISVLSNLDFLTVIFDFAILTESMSAFLLLLAILLFLRVVERTSWSRALVAGVVMGMAALIRPAFAPLLIIALPFYAFGCLVQRRKNEGQEAKKYWIYRARDMAIFFIISIIPCFVCLYGNKVRGNGFSFSPFMLNAGLTNHVGWFFEKLPEKYAPIRDPYVAIFKERKTTVGGYYRAHAKMMEGAEKLGIKSEREFERIITRLSLQLIRDNPGLYMKTFFMAWDLMWQTRPLIYFQPEKGKSGGDNLARLRVKFFWGFWLEAVEDGILQKEWFGRWQFRLLFIAALLLIFLRRKDTTSCYTAVFIFAIVLFLSITTNAVELSENARYRAPFEPLVLLICISGASLLVKYGYEKVSSAYKGTPPKEAGRRKSGSSRRAK